MDGEVTSAGRCMAEWSTNIKKEAHCGAFVQMENLSKLTWLDSESPRIGLFR